MPFEPAFNVAVLFSNFNIELQEPHAPEAHPNPTDGLILHVVDLTFVYPSPAIAVPTRPDQFKVKINTIILPDLAVAQSLHTTLA